MILPRWPLSDENIVSHYRQSSSANPGYFPCRLLTPEQFAPTKLYITRHFSRFFSSNFLLSTLPTIGRKNCAFLQQKTAKNMHFVPVKMSVNTLDNQVYDLASFKISKTRFSRSAICFLNASSLLKTEFAAIASSIGTNLRTKSSAFSPSSSS